MSGPVALTFMVILSVVTLWLAAWAVEGHARRYVGPETKRKKQSMNIVRGKNKSIGQSRDIGLNHGAGKGDAPRSTSRAFYENMEELMRRGDIELPMSMDDSFTKVGANRFRKVYR